MKEKMKLLGTSLVCILAVVIVGLLFPRELGDLEVENVPGIDETGPIITLNKNDLKKVEEMLEYANFFYSPEWNNHTLTDTIIANVGIELTKSNQEVEVGEDIYILKVKKEIFDIATYDFFGRRIKSEETLDTGRVKFENNYYIITKMSEGEEGTYIHKFRRAYDLGDNYIKVECQVDYIFYDIELEGDVFTENAGTAECILKKTEKSPYGYYFMAYRIEIDMR